jgi:tRNA (guanine-N7-)-methyltransferase
VKTSLAAEKPKAEDALPLPRRPSGPHEKLPVEMPAFTELFETPGPLEVEIGCGKAKFMLDRAIQNPGVNFVGIDYAGKWMKIGQKRGEKRNLPNVRFFRVHAQPFLEKYLPDASVSIFHIYFPDPWPKRRHGKRRLVTAPLLRQLHRKLVPQGRVELASDHKDYYELMRGAARETSSLWKKMTESNTRFFCPEFQTNYEAKYAAEGRPLHYLELCK